MSQYCEITEFTAPGVSDAKKLDYVEKASGIADDYIGIKYCLPLISWGKSLSHRVAAIARYLALVDRGMNAENPADALVVKEYDDAMKWLNGVANGVPRLDCVDSTPTVSETAPLVSSEEPMWRYRPQGRGYLRYDDE